MSLELSHILFPDIKKTPQDRRETYPIRPSGQVVTRFAPSPTGMLHMGALYASLANERFAHQQGGIFFVRIEDTDDKRQVDNGIEMILEGLNHFGIEIDEGPLGTDHSSVGKYGPYIQSKRVEIYQTFVKHAVASWFAYPCWMTAQELEELRAMQTSQKQLPWVYGTFSVWRDASLEKIQEQLSKNLPYVIRFKSPGKIGNKIVLHDIVKGEVTTQENFHDHVLLKSDGVPTYHLAHIVDDYLMGTTHVLRADEWFASMPFHVQLFQTFGFQPPIYAHISPILTLEDGKKRKISKRKDVRADVRYFFQQGVPNEGLIEYLCNIIDPQFEDWKKINPDKSYKDFSFKLEHMNQAWALFDEIKLWSVSKECIARMTHQEFFDQVSTRAKIYELELVNLIDADPDYAFKVLNIERGGEKDPKRITKFADVFFQLGTFFDDLYRQKKNSKSLLPSVLIPERQPNFIERYIKELDLNMSKDERFEQLKQIAKYYGFASTNAEFKEGWYIGKIWDIAMFLRIQLCCSPTTPDLYETMQVLGKERVVKRLERK